MKNKLTKLIVALLFVALSTFVVACGDDNAGSNENNSNNNNDHVENVNNNDENENNEEEPKEDITIKWAHQWGEDHFWEEIGDVVADEFPHIEFEVLEAGLDHPEELEEMIAAQEIPDVVSMGMVTHLNFLNNLGLAYKHDELIEKTGFDLDRLEPSIVEYARGRDFIEEEDGLYMIPNGRPTWSLHYDRDVFDTLGVNYPEDGMTWEEVLELARELTREVGGTQYRGLDLDVWYDAFTQFNEATIDPDTDEPLIDKLESVRRFIEYAGEVVSIPGNYPSEEPGEYMGHWGAKLGDGNIAMYPFATNWPHLEENENWDIASYPVWEGYDPVNPVPNSGAWAITEPSEHKEEVLAVIEYLLSDEVQMEKSRDGQASVLVNPDVHAVFGDNNPAFADLNTDSLFVHEYATGPERTSKYGDGVMWSASENFVNSNQDINDYLRELQEIAEENVRQQKASE